MTGKPMNPKTWCIATIDNAQYALSKAEETCNEIVERDMAQMMCDSCEELEKVKETIKTEWRQV